MLFVSRFRNALSALALAAFAALGAQAVEFTSPMSPGHGQETFVLDLPADSAVSLVSVLSGELNGGNSGFGITNAQGEDVVRASTWSNPGSVHGPWPLQAGRYTLLLWNNANLTGSYTAQVGLAPQAGGDSEPNDSAAAALALPPDGTAAGRLGFYAALGNERHDWQDYYRVRLPSRGALSIAAEAADTLRSGFGYTVYRNDASTVVSDSTGLEAGDYYVQVWTNAASAYGSYSLRASFVPASPPGVALVASVSSLDFGAVEVGSRQSLGVTLTNPSSQAQALTGVRANGDFAVRSQCGSTLDAGASCQLTVDFSPVSTGQRSGLLTIASGVGNLSVSLSGTGMQTVVPQPTAGRILVERPVTSSQAVDPVLIFAPAAGERYGAYKLYVAALYQGQLYFVTVRTGQLGVVLYAGGEVPEYMTADGAELFQERPNNGGYSAQTWSLMFGDLSALHGLQLLAGFGRSAEDMLQRGQVMLLHAVP